MGVMDKNLDIVTYAVSLIVKAAIMASRFSGRARKRSLKRLARMDAGTKEKELLFLSDTGFNVVCPRLLPYNSYEMDIQKAFLSHWNQTSSN